VSFSACIWRRSAGVAVIADADTLNGLVDYLHPYFTVNHSPRVSASLPRIYAGIENAAIPLPALAANVSSPGEPDRRVLYDAAGRVFVVDQPPGIWRVIHVGRVLRSIFRWQFYSEGAIYFHAGMVEISGQGVVFAGSKRAGKTSSILAALTHEGARYITNDDLAVIVDGTDALGLGWPRSVSIRQDTVNQLASVLPRLAAAHSKRPQPDIPGQPLLLFPAEIAAVTGRGVLAEAPIRLIVFPEFVSCASHCSIERLSIKEAADRLGSNLHRIPDDRDSYLAEHFTDPPPRPAASCVATLAEQVTCIKLRQSAPDLLAGTAKIISLLQ
jgi:hypothetical protein